MEMLIDFPGGFGAFTVRTDQPPTGGGQGSAPSPFEVFLASIGTCAGIYVLGFCNKRNLPTDGIKILERINSNPTTGMVDSIDLEIRVPESFPEKYYPALVRSAEQCKQHFEKPPVFNVFTKVSK
jgi:putative redox protein